MRAARKLLFLTLIILLSNKIYSMNPGECGNDPDNLTNKCGTDQTCCAYKDGEEKKYVCLPISDGVCCPDSTGIVRASACPKAKKCQNNGCVDI